MGFGFISCPETFDLFGYDVFLHQNQMPVHRDFLGATSHANGGPPLALEKGTKVQFYVVPHKTTGRPMAADVNVIGADLDMKQGQATNDFPGSRVSDQWAADAKNELDSLASLAGMGMGKASE